MGTVSQVGTISRVGTVSRVGTANRVGTVTRLSRAEFRKTGGAPHMNVNALIVSIDMYEFNYLKPTSEPEKIGITKMVRQHGNE